MRGQFVRIGKSSLGRGLVGAAFGSGTFWSLVRAQLVQFVVAQRRGRAGARQPRQPRRQWRAVASRGEQGSKQCGAPDFFDGLGPWACQEAAGWEKLAKNSQAGPGGGCVTEAAIGTRSLVTGVKFFLDYRKVVPRVVCCWERRAGAASRGRRGPRGNRESAAGAGARCCCGDGAGVAGAGAGDNAGADAGA